MKERKLESRKMYDGEGYVNACNDLIHRFTSERISVLESRVKKLEKRLDLQEMVEKSPQLEVENIVDSLISKEKESIINLTDQPAAFRGEIPERMKALAELIRARASLYKAIMGNEMNNLIMLLALCLCIRELMHMDER